MNAWNQEGNSLWLFGEMKSRTKKVVRGMVSKITEGEDIGQYHAVTCDPVTSRGLLPTLEEAKARVEGLLNGTIVPVKERE